MNEKIINKEKREAKKYARYAVVAKCIRVCQEDATKIEIQRLRRLAHVIVDEISHTDKTFDGQKFLEIAGFYTRPICVIRKDTDEPVRTCN
jgi:hypothetical protein